MSDAVIIFFTEHRRPRGTLGTLRFRGTPAEKHRSIGSTPIVHPGVSDDVMETKRDTALISTEDVE